MFTGIIEEKGRIQSISRSRIQRISVKSELELTAGDSIAVQGICLTVIQITKSGFIVEAMRQTLGRTTLNDWRVGDYLNLERALRVDSRLGGHILLGHVDDAGKLVRIKSNEYFFEIDRSFSRYIVPRGSIGIDGASLTVSSIAGNVISVSLIPYTLKNTTLGTLRPGARVNVEYDYLAKVLQRK
jgi:riboflavin synthase